MLVVFDLAARHAVALTGPLAQVDIAASLRAKRPEEIGGRGVCGFAADRTAHREAPSRKSCQIGADIAMKRLAMKRLAMKRLGTRPLSARRNRSSRRRNRTTPSDSRK